MPLWDVASRPPREQFGYWREVICEALVPLTPSWLGGEGAFHSRVETRSLAQVMRVRIVSQPQRTSHGARDVAHTYGSYLFVNLQTEAPRRVRRLDLLRRWSHDTSEPALPAGAA